MAALGALIGFKYVRVVAVIEITGFEDCTEERGDDDGESVSWNELRNRAVDVEDARDSFEKSYHLI